ncbi:MAG: S41 family peptidase [Xanthobacteraceae bacterium]
MPQGYVAARAIQAIHKNARSVLRTSQPLAKFLDRAHGLTPRQRAQVVDKAIMLLEGFYVHLPLKRAMYAIDPVRRLRLLRYRLPQFTSDRQFHAEMTDIFMSLRDLHTNYLLPEPFANAHAWLPFKVEACLAGGVRRYIVSQTAKPFMKPEHRGFGRGVEVVYWNGIPIERAIERAAAQSGGANPASRWALGLAALTSRSLGNAPAPDEHWVKVTYRVPGRAKLRDTHFDWLVATMPPSQTGQRGLALEVENLRRLRRILFKPEVDERDPFLVKEVPTSAGPVGYVRIFTFDVPDADGLVEAFIAHVKRFKNIKGLIVDVRDNGGGRTRAAERLIQLIIPDRPQIAPQRLYFINTPLTLRLCHLRKSDTALGPEGLSSWIGSIKRSVETGATFSASFPYTDPDACNDHGPIYHGPVVVIANALCYSATEYFLAGFQDHGGIVLGVDESTGGGGASARSYSDLRGYFQGAEPFAQKLPNGAELRVAYRRAMRVGPQAGNEIEDFGVTPDHCYEMTRDDLLRGNVDLINHAASLFTKKRRTK